MRERDEEVDEGIWALLKRSGSLSVAWRWERYICTFPCSPLDLVNLQQPHTRAAYSRSLNSCQDEYWPWRVLSPPLNCRCFSWEGFPWAAVTTNDAIDWQVSLTEGRARALLQYNICVRWQKLGPERGLKRFIQLCSQRKGKLCAQRRSVLHLLRL